MEWFKTYANTSQRIALRQLSDAAFRLWFDARCWIALQESDGLIPTLQLPYFGPVGRQEHAEALVWAGLWNPVAGGWEDMTWLQEQDAAQTLKDRRERERMKKQRQRSKVSSS